MPRKSHVIASVAIVLASLLALAVTVPNGGNGLAHAGENAGEGDRHGGGETDRAQDRGSLVLAGRLVRVSDGGAASCERTPAPTFDAAALDATIKRQVVHLARTAAELRGLDEIELPEDLQIKRSDETFAAALRDERAAFAERKEALASQIASLNQAKELEQREIEFTQAKEAALARQGALLQKELDNINDLINKGLAVSSQKLALEQDVMQSETNRLDIKLLMLKAQQEESKIERSITDLRNQWRNEALVEFNRTRQALAAMSQQAHAAASAASGANSAAQAGGSCNDTKESFYVIVRSSGGLLQAFPVVSKNEVQGERSAVLARSGP
jgi:hypothetical protein